MRVYDEMSATAKAVIGWTAFNIWADKQGVGEHPDDWKPWLECWLASATVTTQLIAKEAAPELRRRIYG